MTEVSDGLSPGKFDSRLPSASVLPRRVFLECEEELLGCGRNGEGVAGSRFRRPAIGVLRASCVSFSIGSASSSYFARSIFNFCSADSSFAWIFANVSCMAKAAVLPA